MTIIYQSVAVRAALTGAAGLSACGGGNKPSGVASLNGSNGAGAATTTTVPHGSPSQLLTEWAHCMRQHGVPNLPDPTIDSNGTIHINMPAGPGAGSPSGGPGGPGGGQSLGFGTGGAKNDRCQTYLTAASTALRGGQPLQKPDPAKLTAFSRCMRAHGIADFPDPSPGGGLQLSGGPSSDLNPSNPAFQAAQKTCAKSAGVPFGQPGSPRGGIEVTTSGGPGGGSSGLIKPAGQ